MSSERTNATIVVVWCSGCSSTCSAACHETRTLIAPRPDFVYRAFTYLGFGFNVKGQVSEGGQLRSLNGQLYAPLQHVSAVLPDGAAERANLRRGDRILQVNGVNVEGATHRHVVDLIKHGGDRLTMIVISVEDSEVDKFECCEESVISYRHDYSESRSLPVTIPSYHTVNDGVEKFVVFNLYMAGRHLGSRRYSEFVELHQLLRREFIDYSFPKLPGKWPFSLSEQQLDSRRRGLEMYLERVCSVKVIADSDIMQDFLMECDPSCEVEVRVLLPDGGHVCVNIRRNSSTSLLFALLARKLNMSRDMALSCAVFETMEQSFERKLMDNESPHQLYIQNYSCASSSCLVLRKWIFDPRREQQLCQKDPLFRQFVFQQAVADVNEGRLKCCQKLYQLKAMQNEGNAEEFLEMCRKMSGYNEIAFPPCTCPTRKAGDVVVVVRFSSLILTSDPPNDETQVEISWDDIIEYQVEDGGRSFQFEYVVRYGRNMNRVKPMCQSHRYLKACFGEVKCERLRRSSFATTCSDGPCCILLLHYIECLKSLDDLCKAKVVDGMDSMDCSAPPITSDVKGRIYELKTNEDDHSTPGKVSSKTDSQSTEEALDPEAAEFSTHAEVQEDSQMVDALHEEGREGIYFRRSESPDSFRRSSTSKTQFESPTDEQQHHDTAPTSPMHRFDLTYELEDSRDEVRSESGGVRSRGRGARGRGRGGTRPCSGSATPLNNSPLANPEKKRAGRGRGSKRGRGYGLSRVGDTAESEVGSSVPVTSSDDVYEFKSSPESEFTPVQADFGNRDERECSAPPSAKRQRLTEGRPESHGGSAHSGDIEMDDVEEDEGSSRHGAGDRKVPPLRISLPITQSEEDVHGEHSGHQHSSGHAGGARKGPRGRHGKRHNDADEAQRMTRSKVRQTGRVLDDSDAWTKKKKGRVSSSLTVTGEEADESTVDDASPVAECSDDTSPTCHASTSIPDSLTPEQRIIYENPRTGIFRLKKMLATRWLNDLREQDNRSNNFNEKYKDMLLLTGNYSLCRSGDNKQKEGSAADANSCKKEEMENELAINGDVESEDESGLICAEMKGLWKEHSEERAKMANRMYKEKIKLRLFWEEELLRKEQRETGTTPLMSAVRFLRENEMCNAQILDEPRESLKAMDQAEFTDRRNKSINQMFNRHRMEASSLFGTQRDMWLYEARRRGLDVNPDWVKKCVPLVKITSVVPLSHESSPLAPSLEISLAVIYASYPNIVGVYFSNENYKDRSLNPYAVRLCENVMSVCNTAAVLVQVTNWNLSPDCESNSLCAYFKEGESWKETRLDSTCFGLVVIRGVEAVMAKNAPVGILALFLTPLFASDTKRGF
ncbi:unnamed protein product [Cylicocyclus nassatus]|uniref:Sorting nexin-27 n=1 Tax=Cylicocyclus nassatus TaxID=53992 RepID=A0AA36GKY9_CYLNA|nr:unnamed protein product [Cylicocyclus nassatus]